MEYMTEFLWPYIRNMLLNLDPFLAVINTRDPLELSHHCPVWIAFIVNHITYPPPMFSWSLDLFLVTVHNNIYAHLRVLACKSAISAVQQLYVMTRIICCVTPMTAHRATSMLTHDRSTALAAAAVEDGMVCVNGFEFSSYWETRTMCLLLCLLSLSFILFSRNELMSYRQSPEEGLTVQTH